MELLGIKFAPLFVPMERRLQTLAAAAWFILFVFGGFVGWILVYHVLFTRFYPLAILYLLWMAYDQKVYIHGGRRSEWVRNWSCWHYMREYFPIGLVKLEDLPADKNYLFCGYPHGMLCSGAFGNFVAASPEFKRLFPGLTTYLLTLNVHFNMPIFRELLLCLGSCSSSRESMTYLLGHPEKGKAVVLMVGGASESLYCHPGSYKIILKRRKGFIRVALETGAPLVPVFSFGETDVFDQVSNPPGSWLLWLQSTLKKVLGVAPCIPLGRGIFQYSFGIAPRRTPITTVVGRPIMLPQEPNPSSELVDKYHKIFMEELMELFETHKGKYLEDPKTKLIIE
nr:PREDICTED: 2-acylglycerol O-acyltransferase 2-A-like [Bemisia tabaci]